jgi:hypothetical protein
VGFYLPPYVVVGRPRSFDDVSALFMPHFKYRGIYEIPGKIIQETNAWQPGFHELRLSRRQPVPVPGFHSSRVAGQTAPETPVVFWVLRKRCHDDAVPVTIGFFACSLFPLVPQCRLTHTFPDAIATIRIVEEVSRRL